RGFRHDFSMIRITEILTDGAKPSKTPPARPERAARPPKVEAEGGDEAEKKPSKAKTSAKSAAKTKAKTAAKGKAPAKKTATKKPAAKGKK
ncbi:MAG: 50S ribosomal protein L21, partial [Bradyrhizobium sp.]